MEALYYKVVIVHVNRSLASFELHFLKYSEKTPGTKISIQLQKVRETFHCFLKTNRFEILRQYQYPKSNRISTPLSTSSGQK